LENRSFGRAAEFGPAKILVILNFSRGDAEVPSLPWSKEKGKMIHRN